MSTSAQLRWRLQSFIPQVEDESSLPKEPETHEYLDAGLTTQILYLDPEKWFPEKRGVLPTQTTRAAQIQKGVEREGDFGEGVKNPAEQVRLAKMMKKWDTTEGIERKAKFEKRVSESARLKAAREERSKTAGKAWYDLGKPPMTDELRQEMTVLKLMKYAHATDFKNRGKGFGEDEYFEVGNVVSSAANYYTDPTTSSADGRVRRSSKLSFVDALLADQEFRKYAKRKRQIQAEKAQRNERLSRPPPKMRK